MSVCIICGRRSNPRLHHPTGRGDDGPYLDLDLTMELCHDHHELCHDDWHTFGLYEVPERLTLIEQVELRLRRSALALSRVDAGQGGGTFWGRLAVAMVAWATALRSVVEAFDAMFPAWRSHPAFYGLGPK